MPYLARISIFPIKSLDGMTLPEATVLSSGALQFDRQFSIFDSAGRCFNGKRTHLVNHLRSEYDPVRRTARIRIGDDEQLVSMDSDRATCERWLSEYFRTTVKVVENEQRGFPDDLNAPGPTVINTATLHAIASWFDLELDDARRRFRTNLEIDASTPPAI